MAVETGTYKVGGDGFIGRTFEAPVGCTLDPSKVTANADGYKPIDGLTWVMGPAATARPLPRTNTSAIATASSTTILTVDKASHFVAADVLVVNLPMAQIDLAATWAASDTLDVTVQGLTYSYTSDTATLSEIASDVADGINADATLSAMVSAIASGDSVWVTADDGLSPYTIAVTATTAGDGTAAISGSLTQLTPNQSVGTIAADGVDVANSQLTLAAASAIDLPIGLGVGVATSDILGLIRAELELTQPDNLNQGCFTKVTGVQAAALPYDDGQLKRLFPQIVRV
mgnify:CR=1 FL=1